MSTARLLSALLTGFLLTAGATGCRKMVHRTFTLSTVPDTLVSGTFITTSGTFTHTEGPTTRSLEVTQSGTSLSLSHGSSEELPSGMTTTSSSATSTSISSPSAPWFIYIESPECFWHFDGNSNLSTFHPESGASGPVISSGKIHPSCANVPPEVVLRLPEALKKLLPRVETPLKRPSL